MSWDGTYSHNVLYALDVWAAMIFFNQSDITISSLCRMVQLADFAPGIAGPRLAALKLYRLQLWLLRRISSMLEWLSPGHCERARVADLARADRRKTLLTYPS